MLWNIAVNDAGAEYDPLTLLRSRTMFGRPDWMTIYGRVKQAVEGGQYLPGSNSQLKTKVGVSLNSYVHRNLVNESFLHHRLTSVVLVPWRQLFARQLSTTPAPACSLLSTRYS